MELASEQEELLVRLVEAERRTAGVPGERQYFFLTYPLGPPGVQLIHDGLPDDTPTVFRGDVDALVGAGLLALKRVTDRLEGVYVTTTGVKAYDNLMARKGQSHRRVQTVVREYIAGEEFRSRYPAAFEKWSKAEEILWRTDSANSSTTVGHLAREAMQEFAAALVDRFSPDDVEPDRAKTVARLRRVLQARHQRLGRTEQAFLDALIGYWGAVSDLVQRQEHGGQREGAELTWHDARRVVFQVAMVMFEVDSALGRTSV